MPRWLQIVAQVLPTTQGIIVMRAVAGDTTLVDSISNGSRAFLTLQSVLCLLLEIAFFRFALWRAKVHGRWSITNVFLFVLSVPFGWIFVFYGMLTV